MTPRCPHHPNRTMTLRDGQYGPYYFCSAKGGPDTNDKGYCKFKAQATEDQQAATSPPLAGRTGQQAAQQPAARPAAAATGEGRFQVGALIRAIVGPDHRKIAALAAASRVLSGTGCTVELVTKTADEFLAWLEGRDEFHRENGF